MPEIQPSPAASAGLSPAALAAVVWSLEDPDFAFGCECADPTLQFEGWEPAQGRTPEPS